MPPHAEKIVVCAWCVQILFNNFTYDTFKYICITYVDENFSYSKSFCQISSFLYISKGNCDQISSLPTNEKNYCEISTIFFLLYHVPDVCTYYYTFL